MRAPLLLLALAACVADDDPSTLPAGDLPPPAASALWAGNAVLGGSMPVIAADLNPFDTALLYASVTGRGSGPCPPQFGGLCLDLRNAQLLGRLVADGDGRAETTVRVPRRLPADRVLLQAISGGWINSYKTPVVVRTIQADAPHPIRTYVTDPPVEPYTLDGLTLEGDTLFVDVTYGGGCADHHFEAEWDGSFMESLPEQVLLDVFQYPSGDPCDALISETLRFDVSAIRNAAATTPIVVNVGGQSVLYDFLQ